MVFGEQRKEVSALSPDFFELTPGFSPEQTAKEVLHDLGIRELPIPLKEIIEEFEIDYREDFLSGGFDGCLIRTPAKTGMLINKNIAYLPRKRFTIAHELGHYCLPGHSRSIYECTAEDITRFRSNKREETEANRFAAELLMPERFFLADLKEMKQPSLEEISILASEKYQTSLTATVLRFVQLTVEKCAVFLVENEGVKWVFPSRVARKLNVRNRGPLSPFSLAGDMGSERLVSGRVSAAAWVYDAEFDWVIEESIKLGAYDQILTLVWFPYEESDEEEW